MQCPLVFPRKYLAKVTSENSALLRMLALCVKDERKPIGWRRRMGEQIRFSGPLYISAELSKLLRGNSSLINHIMTAMISRG
jgi:hypothetical protein